MLIIKLSLLSRQLNKNYKLWKENDIYQQTIYDRRCINK